MDPGELVGADTRHGEGCMYLQVELVDVLKGNVEHLVVIGLRIRARVRIMAMLRARVQDRLRVTVRV